LLLASESGVGSGKYYHFVGREKVEVDKGKWLLQGWRFTESRGAVVQASWLGLNWNPKMTTNKIHSAEADSVDTSHVHHHVVWSMSPSTTISATMLVLVSQY
jgi:hypothetical protein